MKQGKISFILIIFIIIAIVLIALLGVGLFLTWTKI